MAVLSGTHHVSHHLQHTGGSPRLGLPPDAGRQFSALMGNAVRQQLQAHEHSAYREPLLLLLAALLVLFFFFFAGVRAVSFEPTAIEQVQYGPPRAAAPRAAERPVRLSKKQKTAVLVTLSVLQYQPGLLYRPGHGERSEAS